MKRAPLIAILVCLPIALGAACLSAFEADSGGADATALIAELGEDARRNPRVVALVEELAARGMSSEEIREAVRKMPTASTAPMPRMRLRDGTAREAEHDHVHEHGNN